MLIFNYGHNTYISQDLFGFFKNGQKKCPKLKIPKYFWEKIFVNIINCLTYLKKTQGFVISINIKTLCRV